MNTRTYRFIDDPGHAWLEVPLADVVEAGSRVSGCSYQKGNLLYLEEDCDASAFIRAMKAKGIEVKWTEVHQDPTPIRNYRSAEPREGTLT